MLARMGEAVGRGGLDWGQFRREEPQGSMLKSRKKGIKCDSSGAAGVLLPERGDPGQRI